MFFFHVSQSGSHCAQPPWFFFIAVCAQSRPSFQCTHKMLSLGMPGDRVNAFLRERCDKFALNESQRATLETFAQNMAQAIAADEAMNL